MPLLRTKKLENASLWVRAGKGIELRHASNPLDSFVLVLVQGQHCQAESLPSDACPADYIPFLRLSVNNLPNKLFEFKEPWISSSKNYWARSLVKNGS